MTYDTRSSHEGNELVTDYPSGHTRRHAVSEPGFDKKSTVGCLLILALLILVGVAFMIPGYLDRRYQKKLKTAFCPHCHKQFGEPKDESPLRIQGK